MEQSNRKYLAEVSQRDSTINILDILKYLFFHWKWFALSVFLFGLCYYYQYSKSSFIYRQSETVMIKTPTNTMATARITKTNMDYNSVNVASEILQLRSKELMRQTIMRIGADKSYTIKRGLRVLELYDQSPVQVEVRGKSAQGVSVAEGYAFSITPQDERHVLLSDWNSESDHEPIKIPLNKEVKTPVGQLLVKRGTSYNKRAYGTVIRTTRYPVESMVGYFMSNLKIIQMEEDAALLQITLEDQNPDRAADLISTLISVYNNFALEDKNQIAFNTAHFIRERLAIIESELGSVESNIERLRTANHGVDVATAGQMYLSDSRQFQSERTKIETDTKLAEMMREYLTSKSKQTDLIPNNTGLVDASVESQIGEYNMTLLRRNRLVEGGSVANPVVQDLDQSLALMRGNIYRAVDNTLAGLDVKLKNALREEQTARGEAMQVPEKQRIMLSVERQQKVKEELYLYLLNKREENALNKAMTEDNIRIIDPASGSHSPIYPSKLRKLAMGMAIGLVIPAVVLLLKLMLDTGVRNRQDVENVVNAPFLGEIPQGKRKINQTGDILVAKTGRDPLTEAFRILRTNIGFMTKDGIPLKVITTTSFGVGVGKTFSALNLAATLSFLDKKVAVLDLDLRKGTLTARMQLMGGKGVSHYLADVTCTIDGMLRRTGTEANIDFFPIGVIAPNPVELLLSKRLDELIAELRDRYDYIVVDGVPMGIVADARIISRISDLTLFVIRTGKMDRRQLPEIEQLYLNGKLSNLAVVLNGLKLGGSGYGYGYGGYGYGYGYGNEQQKNFAKWFAKIREKLPT